MANPPHSGRTRYKMLRGTFENWQSEFLQLLWQLYLGSPSSHENDDRLEAKVDALTFRVTKGKRSSSNSTTISCVIRANPGQPSKGRARPVAQQRKARACLTLKLSLRPSLSLGGYPATLV